MDAALLHCLDHVLSTAQRIKKNNESLRSNSDGDIPRDQGFTRPKVFPFPIPPSSMALCSQQACHCVQHSILHMWHIVGRGSACKDELAPPPLACYMVPLRVSQQDAAFPLCH